ncbi:hypothetical protein [Bacillus mycoides]|uniref:hypothetical protein n=1 Tax=Bacillus mycoides TaxID=1405 RepID=UPI002931BB88|nr:hypothetical protein [Bacillus mycoides]WOA60714.1 hypothetical protein RVY74_29740 [Bacillus mycoides]
MLKHMKHVKEAKNEILLMAILVFFIALFYDEGAAVISVSMYLFKIIARDLFSQKA